MDFFDKVTNELCDFSISLGSATVDRGRMSDVLRKYFRPTEPSDETPPMIVPQSWSYFKESGLLFFINQILHAFGWAIVVQIDEEHGIFNAYPARVRFRGFGPKSIEKGYRNLATFLRANSKDLYDETFNG